MSNRHDKPDARHRYRGQIDRWLNRWVFRPRFWIGLAIVFVLLGLLGTLLPKRIIP